MVDLIKAKAQALKEHKDKTFEYNVRIFDKKADKEVESIFRTTNFNERKKQRLDNWKTRKYTTRKRGL